MLQGANYGGNRSCWVAGSHLWVQGEQPIRGLPRAMAGCSKNKVLSNESLDVSNDCP